MWPEPAHATQIEMICARRGGTERQRLL